MDGRAALHMQQQQQQQHSAAGCKLQSCVGYGRHGVELISDGKPPNVPPEVTNLVVLLPWPRAAQLGGAAAGKVGSSHRVSL